MSARKNGKSLLRKVLKPLAGTLAEQPLRLAVTPAVAKNAVPNRPTLSKPRRDNGGALRVLSFIIVLGWFGPLRRSWQGLCAGGLAMINE